MASLQGVNYAKTQAKPMSDIELGEINGKVRCHYDEYVFAADVNAIGDVILMGGLLPKGARIVDAKIKCPSMGTTGIFELGIQASADGAEAADADAFILPAQADAGGQAVLGGPSAGVAKIGEKLLGFVQPVITLTEATDSAKDKKIQSWIFFVVD